MFETFWIIASATFALIALGFMASFSPLLYAMVGGISQSKSPKRLLIGKLAGIFASILLLSILFQFFHPDTLISLLNSTIAALLISTWFHVLLGSVFIAVAIVQLQQRPSKDTVTHKSTKEKNPWTTASISFLKTTFKVSATAAIFIANRVIIEASPLIAARIVLFVIFLAAALLPFVLLYAVFRRYPTVINNVQKVFGSFRRTLQRWQLVPYASLVVGVLIVVLAIVDAVLIAF